MTKKLIALYLSVITSSSFGQADIKTQNYVVDDFSKIVTHGGGNLNVSYSNEHALEVMTTRDCFELISVSSKTLFIDIQNLQSGNCNCTINIGVPVLHELVQNGGGNVVLKRGLSPMNSFVCKIKGGGDIDLSELSVDSFYASIDGGGKILLNARKKLEGKISGGGLIEYLGDPTVESNVSGGGTIRKH
jgi:Putative auto-transporter adhesin, head GIN domain